MRHFKWPNISLRSLRRQKLRGPSSLESEVKHQSRSRRPVALLIGAMGAAEDVSVVLHPMPDNAAWPCFDSFMRTIRCSVRYPSIPTNDQCICGHPLSLIKRANPGTTRASLCPSQTKSRFNALKLICRASYTYGFA